MLCSYCIENERSFVEEKQIQDFVHRVCTDENLQQELAANPEGVLAREQFTPSVARVISRLVPQLTLGTSDKPDSYWWHP